MFIYELNAQSPFIFLVLQW